MQVRGLTRKSDISETVCTLNAIFSAGDIVLITESHEETMEYTQHHKKRLNKGRKHALEKETEGCSEHSCEFEVELGIY